MCGLFGWSFKRKSRIEIGKREAMASVLAVANAQRGDKSWGIYFHTKKGAFIRKAVGDISNVREFSQYGRTNLVMGHTRQPTTGKVTQKNAHPFTVGNITLAHNGVLSNHEELNKKYSRAAAVDSMHFAHHLNEKLEFSDIEGYGAIEWAHADYPNRIYICRLRSGQLNVRGIKNRKGDTVGVVWSSESRHLEQAIGSARIDSFPFDYLEEGKVFYVEDGAAYKSDSKKLELAERQYTYSRGYYGTDHDGWGNGRRSSAIVGVRYSPDIGYWESETPNNWIWHDGAAPRDREDDDDFYHRAYFHGH